MQVAEWPVKEIVTDSLELSKNFGKMPHTVSHFFSISAVRLTFCLTWNEKGGRSVHYPTCG